MKTVIPRGLQALQEAGLFLALAGVLVSVGQLRDCPVSQPLQILPPGLCMHAHTPPRIQPPLVTAFGEADLKKC